jgi:hypothetical protein
MLRWIRGYYLKMLPLMLIVYAMLAVWASQAWIFIVLAALALMWLQSVISLSIRIRREERAEERGERG